MKRSGTFDAAAHIRLHKLISDQVNAQELQVILEQLETVIVHRLPGAIVEFGCYAGTTSLYIRRLLNFYNFQNEFHVYDSFAGLPDKTAPDQSPAGMQFKKGELSVTKKDFLRHFAKAHLRPPVVHKGWFADIAAHEVPNQIAFAFLDGDFYESIQSTLKLIENKLVPGSIIVVDDYSNASLPGASRAVDAWLATRSARLRIEQSLAIIHV